MKNRIICLIMAAAMAISIMIPFAGATFSDVPSNAWYTKDVEDVQQYGVIMGVGDNRFSPETSLTVAQAIVMANRVHALQNSISLDEYNYFAGSNWETNCIRYAVEYGIVTEDEYDWDIDSICTRLMMAKLFYRVFPRSTEKALNHVTSLPDVDYNKTTEYVFYLYDQGILTGNDSRGTFHPDAGITRAETAAIVNRVLNPAKRKTVSISRPSYTMDGAHRVLEQILMSNPKIYKASVTDDNDFYQVFYPESPEDDWFVCSDTGATIRINGRELGQYGYSFFILVHNDGTINFGLESLEDVGNYWSYSWDGQFLDRYFAYEDVSYDLPDDIGIDEYLCDVLSIK